MNEYSAVINGTYTITYKTENRPVAIGQGDKIGHSFKDIRVVSVNEKPDKKEVYITVKVSDKETAQRLEQPAIGALTLIALASLAATSLGLVSYSIKEYKTVAEQHNVSLTLVIGILITFGIVTGKLKLWK